MATPRDYDRAVRQLHKYVEKMTGDGIPCAVVYGTRNGILKYHGSRVITDVISSHKNEIFDSDGWSDNGAQESSSKFELPRLVKPVSQFDSNTLRRIIPEIMKTVAGVNQIRWNVPENKPPWWPKDIIFANIKQRPRGQQGKESWVECQRRILRSLFSYYGYDAETHVLGAEEKMEVVRSTQSPSHQPENGTRSSFEPAFHPINPVPNYCPPFSIDVPATSHSGDYCFSCCEAHSWNYGMHEPYFFIPHPPHHLH